MGGFHKVDIYDYLYEYDDLKIAVCISEHFNARQIPFDYEDIAELTITIRKSWERDRRNKVLSKEDYAYIQSYAIKYLCEHYGG